MPALNCSHTSAHLQGGPTCTRCREKRHRNPRSIFNRQAVGNLTSCFPTQPPPRLQLMRTPNWAGEVLASSDFVGEPSSPYGQAETVASWMRVIGSYNPYYAMEHNAVEAAMRRAFPGGLQGVRAVDIGCGEGRWARKLAALGADVTGFDPSRELIIQGNKTPLMAGAQGTVELFQGNVLDQSCLEGMLPAGLALSVMVLQMMDSKAQLGAMARFTAAALRPGGFMAFVYVSDEYKPDDAQSRLMLEEFGWQSLRTDPFVTEDGDAIPAVLFTMGGSGATQVLNLQWPRKTVAEAFRAAGFVDLQWSVFEAVPGSRASRCYAKNPHSVLLTAFLRS